MGRCSRIVASALRVSKINNNKRTCKFTILFSPRETCTRRKPGKVRVHGTHVNDNYCVFVFTFLHRRIVYNEFDISIPRLNSDETAAQCGQRACFLVFSVPCSDGGNRNHKQFSKISKIIIHFWHLTRSCSAPKLRFSTRNTN